MNRMYPHTMEYYLSKKENEVLICVTTLCQVKKVSQKKSQTFKPPTLVLTQTKTINNKYFMKKQARKKIWEVGVGDRYDQSCLLFTF